MAAGHAHSALKSISGRIALGYSDFTKDAFYYAFGFPPVNRADPSQPLINRRPSLAWDRQRDLTTQAELYARFSMGAVEHKALIGAERGYDHWRFEVLNTRADEN